MKKFFVRCSSQHGQNTTLKIEAENSELAKEIAFNTYRVKQVFNISEDRSKVDYEWRKRHSAPHVIQRKGKYLTVFC
ncbi:hypothetical protein D3C84_887590 [compost metagenome]